MLREPVHYVAVVGGNPAFIPLAVAKNILFRQAILLAKISTQLHSFLIHSGKILAVGQAIFANLKGNMCVVCGTNRAVSSMPAAPVPGKGLVSGNLAIGQLADKGVHADIRAAGLVLVPVVAVLVFTQQAVIRVHIPAQTRIVCAGRVHHDALRSDFPAGFVAGVFG